MNRAEYQIEALRGIGAGNGIVFISDLNRGALSVTNDAERVCRVLHSDWPGYRIMYRDSEGRWDELRHERGVFKSFGPGFAP